MAETAQGGSSMDVVLTCRRGRVGYNVLRSLGRHGLRVAVGVDADSGMGPASRYATRTFRHPKFYEDEEGFIAALREALRTYRPAVYLPTDEEIFAVARHRDQFEDLPVRIPIDGWATLSRLHSKEQAEGLARSLSIPTPATLTPGAEEDVRAFGREYGFPIVLKVPTQMVSSGVFYLHEEGLVPDLARVMQSMQLAYGDFIIQEHVKGTGHGVSALFCHGHERAFFVHERLRERVVTGGASTIRRGVRLPELEEYALTLLRHVNFHGVAMVEFKYDAASGRAWFLEVNPRFWGSLALAMHSGVDFPYLLYRMALDGDVTPVTAYQTGVTVTWRMGDWMAWLHHLKTTGRPPRRPGPRRRPDGYDDFYRDDPLPFLAQCLLPLRARLQRGRRRRRTPGR